MANEIRKFTDDLGYLCSLGEVLVLRIQENFNPCASTKIIFNIFDRVLSRPITDPFERFLSFSSGDNFHSVTDDKH